MVLIVKTVGVLRRKLKIATLDSITGATVETVG